MLNKISFIINYFSFSSYKFTLILISIDCLNIIFKVIKEDFN